MNNLDKHINEAYLTRNSALGVSSVCLLLVLMIAQGRLESFWINISLHSAAVSMPLWIGLSVWAEFYITSGKKGLHHFTNSVVPRIIFGALILPGILSLLSAVGALLFHLGESVVFYFAISSISALTLIGIFHHHLDDWTESDDDNSEGNT